MLHSPEYFPPPRKSGFVCCSEVLENSKESLDRRLTTLRRKHMPTTRTHLFVVLVLILAFLTCAVSARLQLGSVPTFAVCLLAGLCLLWSTALGTTDIPISRRKCMPARARFFVLVITFMTLMALVPGTAWAQLPPTDDTYTTSADSTPQGGATLLAVQSGTKPSYTYIKFDLTSLTGAGVTSSQINQAYLKLYVSAVTAQGTFDVYEVIASAPGEWNEHTLTTSKGGYTLTNSVSMLSSAVPVWLSYNSCSTYTATTPCYPTVQDYVTIDVTQAVKDWLSLTHPNNGLVLTPHESINGSSNGSISVSFSSKEDTTYSHDPQLIVELSSTGSDPGVTSVTASSPLASSGGKTPNISLTGTVPIANGGTGATTAATALSNLGAQPALGYIPAPSGANSDITSLSGLTTPLAVSEGGTGTATFVAHTFFGNNTAATGAPAPVRIGASDWSPNAYVAGGGSAQAQTVTLIPAATALTAGLEVFWKPTAANTGAAPTLAVNGLAAKPITKLGTAALVANDLNKSAIAYAIYDGTEWQLQNPQTTGTIKGATFTGGLISVSGSPTLAFTVAGTTGGIPYFSSGTTWASSGVLTANGVVLGGGASGPTVTAPDSTTTHALFATAGAPAFRALAGTDMPAINLAGSGNGGVTGTLPVGNGGTGVTTTSQNFVFAGPAGGAGAPTFRALVAGDIPSLTGTYVNLTSAQTITGAKTFSSGSNSFTGSGAGLTSLTAANISSGTAGINITGSAATAASATTAGNVTGTVAVANGGTGDMTLASNGVLFGSGTGAVQTTAQGAANSILTANAGAPSFSQTPTIRDVARDRHQRHSGRHVGLGQRHQRGRVRNASESRDNVRERLQLQPSHNGRLGGTGSNVTGWRKHGHDMDDHRRWLRDRHYRRNGSHRRHYHDLRHHRPWDSDRLDLGWRGIHSSRLA